MNIETVGHAGLLIRDDAGAPVLFTDPWITGSCYWRSWWLQNYPSPELLEELRSVAYCFITHEHPDHFHTASIRQLGRGVRYLSPEFPHGHIAEYLAGQGYRVGVVAALQWTSVHPEVRLLSIPLFNDDSVLVIDTPQAIIVNQNDSKPRRGQLRQLRKSLDELAPGKRRILLSSYSPASIVNSFVRDAQRVSMKEKTEYVRYVADNCELLGAHDFMPFASQVIYKRRDSAWANDFKVTYDDLKAHWRGRARLLPPFSQLNLADGTFTSVPPERYRHEDAPIQLKVETQHALDQQVTFDDGDLARLEEKLNHCRWLLAILFPRGIGFELEADRLHYAPWSGRLTRGNSPGDFALRVPAQAVKDAVTYGHFGDLGTTMFTMVMLNSRIHPRRVYLFFLVMTLHDYGHTTSVRNWLTWLGHSARNQSWRIPRDMSRAAPV